MTLQKIDSMNGMDLGLLRAFVDPKPETEKKPEWPETITHIDGPLSDIDYFEDLVDENDD